jgi:hypothetical protein
VLVLPPSFDDARLPPGFRAAPVPTRFAAFFLLAFRLGRFVDFFAELLAFRFVLPRAAAFFRAVFFFLAVMVRLVLLIRFHLPAERLGEALENAFAY